MVETVVLVVQLETLRLLESSSTSGMAIVTEGRVGVGRGGGVRTVDEDADDVEGVFQMVSGEPAPLDDEDESGLLEMDITGDVKLKTGNSVNEGGREERGDLREAQPRSSLSSGCDSEAFSFPFRPRLTKLNSIDLLRTILRRMDLKTDEEGDGWSVLLDATERVVVVLPVAERALGEASGRGVFLLSKGGKPKKARPEYIEVGEWARRGRV